MAEREQLVCLLEELLEDFPGLASISTQTQVRTGKNTSVSLTVRLKWKNPPQEVMDVLRKHGYLTAMDENVTP